jgi:hypothetical protein
MGLLELPREFVQEEYLVSGTAHPFYGPAVLAQLPVPDIDTLPPLPFTTRILVVRPRQAAESNHTAIVTWQNVTFGHDIGEWFDVGRQVVADGYTYVEADVQLASQVALKVFDPVRYATVNIPDDAYSYDIYSQVAKALRHRSTIRGTPLRHVIALGASQSGFAIDQYLTAVQPYVERVYDGFIDAVANGPDHHSDRPVIRLLSEDEINGSSASRDSHNYRQWEVAGSAHGNKADFDYIAATERRDLGVDLVDPLVRDRVGNAVGGIRLPAMAVPTAAYNRTGDCVALDGRTEAFSGERLRALYPTHRDYVRKVRLAVRQSMRAGVLTRAFAPEVIREARRRLPARVWLGLSGG